MSGVFAILPNPPSGDPALLGRFLSLIVEFLCRYIAFRSKSQAPIIALWVVHSHTIAAFDYTPYLHVSSPEKRCGKSRVLDLLNLLVRAPWPAVSPSEAVIYRKIEAASPTLLLDEVDTIFAGGKDENKEGLRALLNAGFQRSATVPRCVGPKHQIQDFKVFCPKVIAGIGKLPDTVADRSVPIVLARKARNQIVERFRGRDAAPIAEGIRTPLASWAGFPEIINSLRDARPSIPDSLGDRQADICEPLLAIADLAGGEWPARARAALVDLFTANEGQDDSLGVKLLTGIHRAFGDAKTDRLSTEDVLKALLGYDDGPWANWWERDIQSGNVRGPSAKLARMLKPFGIQPCTIRQPNDTTPKGYKRESFEDAWERYLPAKPTPGAQMES